MFLNQLKWKLKDETHTLLQTAIQTCEFEHWSSIKPKKYNTKNGNNAKTQHGKQEKYINKIISKTPPNKVKYNNEIKTSPI